MLNKLKKNLLALSVLLMLSTFVNAGSLIPPPPPLPTVPDVGAMLQAFLDVVSQDEKDAVAKTIDRSNSWSTSEEILGQIPLLPVETLANVPPAKLQGIFWLDTRKDNGTSGSSIASTFNVDEWNNGKPRTAAFGNAWVYNNADSSNTAEFLAAFSHLEYQWDFGPAINGSWDHVDFATIRATGAVGFIFNILQYEMRQVGDNEWKRETCVRTFPFHRRCSEGWGLGSFIDNLVPRIIQDLGPGGKVTYPVNRITDENGNIIQSNWDAYNAAQGGGRTISK